MNSICEHCYIEYPPLSDPGHKTHTLHPALLAAQSGDGGQATGVDTCLCVTLQQTLTACSSPPDSAAQHVHSELH